MFKIESGIEIPRIRNIIVNGMKICNVCKIEKSLLHFNKRKSNKNGYVPECKECRKEYNKTYNEINKEKIKIKNREWNKANYKANKKEIDLRHKKYDVDNKEERKLYTKNYYINNKEKINIQHKEYRENNKEEIKLRTKRWKESERGKEYRREFDKERLSTPRGKINNTISSNILLSLKDNKHGRHWEDIVGYTLQELMSHLENQFINGMNWDNYGNKKGCWSIDHILPISSFDFDSCDDEDFKRCWSLENLRPLDHIENIKKGNKVA